MVVRLIDLLPSDSGIIFLSALEKLAFDANNIDKFEEFRKIIALENKKNGIEKLMIATNTCLRLFLRSGGNYLSNEFFDLMKAIIKKT